VANAGQAKERGYQEHRSDTLVYLHKVLLTLTGEFSDDRYFEAYLVFVDKCEQASAEGCDPEEVEFIPPSSKGEAAKDEATNPSEAKASASEEEDREDGGEPDV